MSNQLVLRVVTGNVSPDRVLHQRRKSQVSKITSSCVWQEEEETRQDVDKFIMEQSSLEYNRFDTYDLIYSTL